MTAKSVFGLPFALFLALIFVWPAFADSTPWRLDPKNPHVAFSSFIDKGNDKEAGMPLVFSCLKSTQSGRWQFTARLFIREFLNDNVQLYVMDYKVFGFASEQLRENSVTGKLLTFTNSASAYFLQIGNEDDSIFEKGVERLAADMSRKSILNTSGESPYLSISYFGFEANQRFDKTRDYSLENFDIVTKLHDQCPVGSY